jgi:hypothetical protein
MKEFVKKHWGIIAVVGGFVVALWLYLKDGSQSVTTSIQPSTSASGVPNWSAQSQQGNTKPNQVSPSPEVSQQSSSTLHQQPALDDVRTSQPGVYGNDRQSYNVPPQGNLSMMTRGQMAAASGANENHKGCGCGSAGSCKSVCPDNNAQFTDGQGAGCMSFDRKKQIDNLEKKYPGVWDAYTDQVMHAGFRSEDVAAMVYLTTKNQSNGMPDVMGDKTLPAAPGEWIHPMVYRPQS